MRKKGSTLFLMELLIVLVFFSLCITVTLRLFMTSYMKEQESARLDEALILTQNTAEQFRAKGSAIFHEEGWTEKSEAYGNSLFIHSGNTNSKLVVEVSLEIEETSGGLLEFGEVRAYSTGKPEPLCRLSLARYYTP